MGEKKDVVYININELGLSQIYLSKAKIDKVMTWFDPLKCDEYEPLAVHDFMNNGKLVLTDGHSRAYVAYRYGISRIAVRMDYDEIVTSNMGIQLYKESIDWCNRFSIRSIKDLEQRIIEQDEYKFLWIERCDRKYDLLMAIENRLITPNDYINYIEIGKMNSYFLYGASEDLSCLYYDDIQGDLWIYHNKQFHHEYSRMFS